MRFLTSALFAATLISLSAQAPPAKLTGKQIYTLHCSACHQMDKVQVGPSLVEIAQLYRGKQADFIKWCLNPLPHKRKNGPQMPAMIQLNEADLKLVYDHLMFATKGKKQAKEKKGDSFPETLSARPLVQRMFLDHSGPASIAVALPGDLNLCWDAGACRLRYLWKGGFLNAFPYWQGNGNSLAQLKGDKILAEEQSPLPFLAFGKPKFLGYSMKDGLPTFKYRVGELEVHERFEAIPDGFSRSFTFKNAPSELLLEFQKSDKFTYSSESGPWTSNLLRATTTAPVVIQYKLTQ